MGLLAYIADRPERHAIIHQAQGGVFGKRILWSAFIDKNNLPYCNKCFGEEVSTLLRDPHSESPLLMCGHCCQWDITSRSPSNRKVRPSEIKLTQKDPTRADKNSPPAPVHRSVPNNYLCPVDLDFTWMTTILRYAAHNITHMKWNKGTAESYCKSCAIPERAIDQMYVNSTTWTQVLTKKESWYNQTITYHLFGYPWFQFVPG